MDASVDPTSIKPERPRSDNQSRIWLADFNGGKVTADLNERWPFGDGEIGVFRAHDALEPLRDPIHTMPNSIAAWPRKAGCSRRPRVPTATAHFKTRRKSRSGTRSHSGTSAPTRTASSTAPYRPKPTAGSSRGPRRIAYEALNCSRHVCFTSLVLRRS